jgi:hypothetical protein
VEMGRMGFSRAKQSFGLFFFFYFPFSFLPFQIQFEFKFNSNFLWLFLTNYICEIRVLINSGDIYLYILFTYSSPLSFLFSTFLEFPLNLKFSFRY